MTILLALGLLTSCNRKHYRLYDDILAYSTWIGGKQIVKQLHAPSQCLLQFRLTRSEWGRFADHCSYDGHICPFLPKALVRYREDQVLDLTKLRSDPVNFSDAYCKLFGESATFELETAEEALTASLAFPAPLSVEWPELDTFPVLRPGTTVHWNKDPANSRGIDILMSWVDTAKEGEGPGIHWFINVPDTGAYTFREGDFPQLPAGDLMEAAFYRVNTTGFSSPAGQKFFVLADTRTVGVVRFQPR